jgi:hypothetical protein
VSCCMRDADTLERLGIPTAILVNDVFEPIAYATATLLNMPASYVEERVIWLPHPTSMLSKPQAQALIDARIDRIRAALDGTPAVASAPSQGISGGDPLAAARSIAGGLAASLRADGADLVLDSFDGGVLRGRVILGELTCSDGSCIMPAPQLAKMLQAMIGTQLGDLQAVELSEVAGT